MQGPYVDCSKPFKKTTVCAECGEKFKRGEAKQIVEVYDDPWAKKPRVIAVHSDYTGDDDKDSYGTCLDKLTDTSWADFRYQVCDVCERMIISQCPSNGWRSYFKPYGDGEICVKCYQDQVLKDGHGKDSFEDGRVPGDFFNREEIGANGWSKVSGGDVFINGTEGAKRFCDLALKMIKDGHKVLVDYGALGIGGGEGYVTMYCK